MMRCIESGIAAGHISREDGERLQRDINRLLRENLAPPEIKARIARRLESEALEARRRALLNEARRAEIEQSVLSFRNARGENDPAAALIYLLEHHGEARFADVEHRRVTILAGIHSDLENLLYEMRRGALVGDKRRQRDSRFSDAETVARLDNIVRELFGEGTKDAPAKEMAQAVARVIEMVRQRANAAGASIAKLDRYVPQLHSAEALIDAGQSRWVDYMMEKGVLARHRMLTPDGKPMGDDELREALEVAWQRITTDGWIDRQPSMSAYGKGPLYDRFNDGRFIHFADADAWLQYQRNFGGGDPYSAILGYFARMARDIAFMEILGPNPDAMKNWVQQLVMKQAAVARPAAVVIGERTEQLRKLIAEAAGAGRYEGMSAEIGRIVGELDDLHRRVRAQGAPEMQLQNSMWNRVDRLEQLHAEIGSIEAAKPDVARRRILERMQAIERALEVVGGKGAPQLGGGLSRRNRKKVAQLRAEEERLRAELDTVERSGTTLQQVDPDLAGRIRDYIDQMRGDLSARTHADDLANVEGVIGDLLEKLKERRTFQGEVDSFRRLKGEDAVIEALQAQRAILDHFDRNTRGAKFKPDSLTVDIRRSFEATMRDVVGDREAFERQLRMLEGSAQRRWGSVAFAIWADQYPHAKPDPRFLQNMALRAESHFLSVLRELPDGELSPDSPALRRAVRAILRKSGMEVDQYAPLLPYQPEAEQMAADLAGVLDLFRNWRKTGDQVMRDRFSGQLARIMSTDLAQVGMEAGEIERALRMVTSGQELFVRPQGFRAVADPVSSARHAIKRMDAMWAVMRGNAEAPVHAGFANVMQAGRNIMGAALLGQALLSSFSDVAFQRAARSFSGMSGSMKDILGGTISQFATANRREAVRAGLILDSALHVMQQQARYLEGVDTRTLSGYVADRVISLSGLSAWTQAGKHAFGMAFQAELAERVKLPFHELPDVLRRTLQRHGLAVAEWDLMRSAQVYNPTDGLELLRPNEIASQLVPRAREVAEAYLAMIHRETKFAVPEGTVRWESIVKANQAGTLAGELMRNFGQFKSFSAAVLMLHGGRIQREMQAGRVGQGLQMATSLLITGVMAGALVIELKDIVNGRDPRGMRHWTAGRVPPPDYWMQAMLQAGGLGIIGDFMLQGVNRPGGGLSSFVVGPWGGQIDKMRDRTIGNVDELLKNEPTRWQREAVAVVRDLMPGGTLWYLRLAKERLIMNNIEYALSPEAAGRSWGGLITTTRKKQGTEFWWQPGETAPRRAPLQAQAIGR